MSRIYGSLEELIGSTPLLELKNIERAMGFRPSSLASSRA